MTIAANLDTIPYACAYCGVPLRLNKQRSFPDELCMRCYRLFKDYKEAPWMQDLIRKEKSRRMRLYRLKTRGIAPEVISYEEYMKPFVDDHSEDDAYTREDDDPGDPDDESDDD